MKNIRTGSALTLLTSMLCATAAAASLKNFDIPEQSLASGLIEFALQADIAIVADNDLLKGFSSTPLHGPIDTNAALSRLISGTTLSYHINKATNTYIIDNAPALKPAPGNINSIPDEVVVTGLRLPFRYNTITNTQREGNHSYFDVSRFLNTIPHSLVEDQQAAELGDVLKFASGVTPGDGLSDSNDDVYIRGFQRHAIYVDGFRLSDTTGIKLFTANTERIEILKGPSTLHYGQAEPGGIVNVVRKKPQDDNFVRAEFGGGTLGRAFANLDMNGQIPGDSDIDVRLVLADDRQDDAGEIHNISKQLIAPSLIWKISDNTQIDANYEHQDADQTQERTQQILKSYEDQFAGAQLKDASKYAHPDFNATFDLFNAGITHYFTPEWKLNAHYFWQKEHRNGIRTSADVLLKTDILFKKEELGNNFLLLLPGGEVAIPIVMHTAYPETLYSIGKIRSLYDEKATETVNNASINLEGTFETGTLTHHLISGGDWHRQDIYKQYFVETRDLFPGELWTNDELPLPDIAKTIFDPERPLGSINDENLGLIYDDYGAYLQDSVELNERWIASLGTRYIVTTGEYTDFNKNLVVDLHTYKKFSSQFGLVYKTTDNTSLFANYSEALRANYHLDNIGAHIAEPELSNQVEVGVKSQAWDGRLMSSIALFDINKKNIVTVKIVDGVRTLLSAHEQQVRGVDIDFTLQASPNLNIIGAASFIDPEITSGENKGKKPTLAADSTASLFVNYALTRHLNLSSGVNYVSKRFGDDENKFSLYSYSTVDLGLAYSFTLFSTESKFQISAKNLFDTEYYTAILSGVRTNKSDGRTLVASLKIEL